jgi:hypothetical protein
MINTGKFNKEAGNDGIVFTLNKYPHKLNHQGSTYGYENQYDGSEKIYIYNNIPTFSSQMTVLEPIRLTTGNGFTGIFCTNLNGEGNDEIVKINNYISGNYEKLDFTVYETSINGDFNQAYIRSFTFPIVLTDANGSKSIHPKFFYPGDFNGDGKTEILAVSCHNPLGKTTITSKAYLFDLVSGTKSYENYVFPLNIELRGKKIADSYG